MKSGLLLIVLSCITSCAQAITIKDIKNIQPNASMLTYELNGGRFGDNLFSYSRAKWLSYVYDIPVLYVSFPYADQLVFSLAEPKYKLGVERYFSAKKYVNLARTKNVQKESNTLYVCHWKSGIKINWNNKTFVDELKKSIAPLNMYEKVSIPAEHISIAVHIRTGGGFAGDTAIERERCPLRFVPDEFFIDQIRRIASDNEGQKVYVHIFTDHQEPQVIAEKFSHALNNNLITFGYRGEGNSYKANVLDDFFAMMDFYYLIRPGSHFSRFVERLGNNAVVIFPASSRKISEDAWIIDKISIKTRTARGWKTRHEVIA